jgi:DNA-binding MurR/RpiR family transcriptional regulator
MSARASDRRLDDALDDDIAARIESHRGLLSPAERQVAEIVLRDPEAVAFGTVARLAERAGTSGASVVRLATRLGYPGFSGLQAAVQAAIGQQLRPAVERIRAEQGDDVVSRTLRAEVGNVQRTLDAVDPDAFADAVRHIADRRRRVVVVAGDAESGVGAMCATALSSVRDGVTQVGGSDVAVARQMATVGTGTVVVAIDLRRYERWVVDCVTRAVHGGATAIAVTDSLLSPLAAQAEVTFTVAAEGAGVFDSHVGTLALVNALVTGAAAHLRRTATDRLDAVEAAWRAAGALVDE